MNISPAREPAASTGPSANAPRRNPSDELRILEHSFKVGIFADPPAKKSLVLGGDLLTKRHVRLVADLRTEAARVSYDNQVLRDKCTTFERRYRVAKMDLIHTREQLSLVQARYSKMRGELEASQHFMRKLDNLFSGEKTQRLARAMSLPDGELEDAQLLEDLGETPHFEFRNPFDGSRAAGLETP